MRACEYTHWRHLRRKHPGKEEGLIIENSLHVSLGFPGGASGKVPACNAGDIRDELQSLGRGRSPGERNAPTPVFLPGECHGQRRLAGHSPWDIKRVGHDQNELACMHTFMIFLN